MDKTYYITTPIYYVNSIPHIGHAYTTVCSDVISRFIRLKGKKVKFLTGTDEHGQKVQQASEKLNIPPEEFTKKISDSFKYLNIKYNISHDDFIRTTEIRHKKTVEYLWTKLLEKGFIYLDKYSGWYSTTDETFYNNKELINGKAPTGAKVEWLETESFFFALSKFQKPLLRYYENNPDFIFPNTRRNEVISFVKNGLEDLSISRTNFTWGIQVPNKKDHTIYVWIDALTNYLSAIGYPDNSYLDYWPANIHIVGKDILRFHAIYWPAILLAAEIPLPKKIAAHGWWTNEGEKISKSLGNIIDPIKLVEDFGVDRVRYFLIRQVIFGNDGDYREESLIKLVNSELSNKIGNLCQRTLKFIQKYANSSVPQISDENINRLYQTEEPLIKSSNLKEVLLQNIPECKFNIALDKIIELAESANQYMEMQAPWSLYKTDIKKSYEILYTLLETIRYLGIALLPFIPTTASKILDLLNLEQDARSLQNMSQNSYLKPTMNLPEPEIVIPKIDL